MKKFLHEIKKKESGIEILIVFFVICALVLFAWFNKFLLDDAFISFRYALSFAEGNGLAWNVGERVEGYSNFLWTMFSVIPHVLGLEIVKWVYVVGMVLLAGSLSITYVFARSLLKSFPLALLAVLLLGTNYSFSAYATGGLETQLHAFLITLGFYLHYKIYNGRQEYIHLSLVLSLCLLNRLDSAIVVLPILVFTLIHIYQKEDYRLKCVLGLVLPMLLIVGSWLGWKWGFYGSILPNTYFAKLDPPPTVLNGFAYVAEFFVTYLYLPYLLLFGLVLFRWSRIRDQLVVFYIGIFILWLVYVVAIGGGFMEFRFLVPMLPIFIILVVWSTFRFVYVKNLQIVLLVTLFLGFFHHYVLWSSIHVSLFEHRVSSIKILDEMMTGDPGFIQVGEGLGRYTELDSSVYIATSAAGAIPYYSHLGVVDTLGLNDVYIARLEPTSDMPGHQKFATKEYLDQRDVNLYMGHPRLSSPKEIREFSNETWAWLFAEILKEETGKVRFVEIPMKENSSLLAVYMHPHPLIEQLIQQGDWNLYDAEIGT